MAAKMKWARAFVSKARIGLEDAKSGAPYLCEHCSAEVRYNAGYEMVRKGVSVAVEHYFKLRQKHVHADECQYNIEAQIKAAVQDADPEAVHQLRKGLYELRLMFPESYKTARPSDQLLDASDSANGPRKGGRKYVSTGKLNSYLNTAARILKVRQYCEENQDIEEHLVLSFGDHKVQWSEFYIEQDEYATAYQRLSAGSVDHPIAVAGTIQSINARQTRDKTPRTYWVVQFAVPRCEPDSQGVVTKVDAHVMTGTEELINGLNPGDSVIVFGEWQARPPKNAPNPKAANSSVKVWRNLPMKFSLTHAKQIVSAKI
jgi:hypothetical protein